MDYLILPFKHQPRKMVRHTQTICRRQMTNCFSVFDHFVGLAFKELLLVIMVHILLAVNLNIFSEKWNKAYYSRSL